MLTNSDCTIYRRIGNGDDFVLKKQYVSKCWWFEGAKADITTNGLKSADVLKVRIPDVTVQVKKGDIIVKGNCDIEAQTVKDLSGVAYFKVTAANYNMFSDEMHIKVVAV
jgi:hypothetical protein